MPPRETDDPRADQVLLVGLVGALLLVALIYAVQAALLALERGQIRDKVYAATPVEFRQLHDAQVLELVDGPRWADPNHQAVKLPIDMALEAYVRRQAAEADRQ